jgi:hypothetical protein
MALLTGKRITSNCYSGSNFLMHQIHTLLSSLSLHLNFHGIGWNMCDLRITHNCAPLVCGDTMLKAERSYSFDNLPWCRMIDSKQRQGPSDRRASVGVKVQGAARKRERTWSNRTVFHSRWSSHRTSLTILQECDPEVTQCWEGKNANRWGCHCGSH